jgi:hypothetical protein
MLKDAEGTLAAKNARGTLFRKNGDETMTGWSRSRHKNVIFIVTFKRINIPKFFCYFELRKIILKVEFLLFYSRLFYGKRINFCVKQFNLGE